MYLLQTLPIQERARLNSSHKGKAVSGNYSIIVINLHNVDVVCNLALARTSKTDTDTLL